MEAYNLNLKNKDIYHAKESIDFTVGTWSWSSEDELFLFDETLKDIFFLGNQEQPEVFLADWLEKVSVVDRDRIALKWNDLINGDISSFDLTYCVVNEGKSESLRTIAKFSQDSDSRQVRVNGMTWLNTSTENEESKFLNIVDRYETALSAATVGIFEWEISTNKLLWDDRMYKIYGCSEGIDSFKNWEKLLSPKHRTETISEVSRALSGFDLLDTRFHIIQPKTKKIRVIRSFAKTFCDHEGAPVKMLGANWDITEAYELRKQLEQSNKELQSFASVASHDLREPLRGIKVFAELLEDEYSSHLDDKAMGYISKIGISVSRMNILIEDLMNYAKIGGTNRSLKSTPICKVLNEVCEDLVYSIKSNQAVVLYEGMPTVHGRKTQLKQLFSNIISNAIKYKRLESNPEINISCTETESSDYIQFCVEDNGRGFDEKYKEKVFDIFTQLKNKDTKSGIGLGLALCKKIVEQHDGKIWAESKLGLGTKIYFTLRGS